MQILGTLILLLLVLLVDITRGMLKILQLLYVLTKKGFTILDKQTANLIDDIFSLIVGSFRTFMRYFQTYKRFLRKRLQRRKKERMHYSFSFTTKLKYFLFGGFFMSLFIVIPYLLFITVENLPSPTDLSGEQIPETTKIYDRNRILLYEIFATENRTYVPLSQIPKDLRNATIAIEDKNFYKNPGVDFAAIMRAAIADIRGQNLQGGSTITQQLVKVSLLSPKISILRKIQEVILAIWTEKVYTKSQILEMYFNRVSYGGTAWGVEAAAEVYFGKPVSELDVAQCAFLAGIPRAPSIYSPFSETPNIWKSRQLDVLNRMKQLGYISPSEEKQAKDEQLIFQPPQLPFHAPHFVMYIKNLLVQKYGLEIVEKGGLEVVTSLDVKTQDMAQNIVKQQVEQNSYLNISNGAAVISNPKNGDILAMVGGKDYNAEDSGNVNVATSLRQPGSSIKVVTYAAALSKGMTPVTRIDDTPATFPLPGQSPYAPVDYDGKWHGSVTMRTALANSLNMPAVKTLNAIGIPTFVDLAKQMGISSLGDPAQYGLSITLGGAEVTMLDMATAYGTLANMGDRVNLNPILKITDSKGKVLEEKHNVLTNRVIDPGVTFILANILSDNNARSMEFGPDSPLKITNYTVAVKTGTSDNKRDNWTIGYTPSYVVTTWVGNNNGDPMNQSLASGITGAAPMWHDIMSNLLQNKPNEPFIKPSNIVEKSCFGRTEYFIQGTENAADCTIQSSISPTNQQASEIQPAQRFVLPPWVWRSK